MSKPPVQTAMNLSAFTTWHVGGPAEYFAIPATCEELASLLKHYPDCSVTWLGLGSNLLVRDGGVKGLVIHTRALDSIKMDQNLVYADAGVTCAKLARFFAEHDYSDTAWFAGIPGTVGGALMMNAGAFGGECWQHVVRVVTVDRSGAFHHREPDAFQVEYRSVNRAFSDEAFVGAWFTGTLKPGSRLENLVQLRDLIKERNAKQPIGTYNCGSVFRNPEGYYAAKLIEECGLKGFRVGGAIVSEKHANFILNHENASSDDIESLIGFIQDKVQQQFEIRLEPEVRIIGAKQGEESNVRKLA